MIKTFKNSREGEILFDEFELKNAKLNFNLFSIRREKIGLQKPRTSFKLIYLFSGGAEPGNAMFWPGMVYWGRNCAKLTPKAPGSCPAWNPDGNCPDGVIWKRNVASLALIVLLTDLTK